MAASHSSEVHSSDFFFALSTAYARSNAMLTFSGTVSVHLKCVMLMGFHASEAT